MLRNKLVEAGPVDAIITHHLWRCFKAAKWMASEDTGLLERVMYIDVKL